MGKGRYRNRNWNNGWGCDRVHRVGGSDLKWASLSTIETVRRAQSVPTARQSEATRASEETGTGEKSLDLNLENQNQLNTEAILRLNKTGPDPNISIEHDMSHD